MVDEATREGTAEYLVFMCHEGVDALVLQFTDDTGTQIDNLLVFIGELFALYALQDMLLCLWVEEVEHETRSLFKGNDFQLMSILQVHNLVTDIIGGFYEIDQWMAHITEGLARL